MKKTTKRTVSKSARAAISKAMVASWKRRKALKKGAKAKKGKK